MQMLDGLNEAQKAAAGHVEGPMMVVAGAGSGKTRVLTHRIAHLIDQGVDPFSILSLTFTNKAAREMKDRIGRIVGDAEARNIWMGTFHSVFARILRIESDRINYPSNFTIYDTTESRNVIKDIIKREGLDVKLYKPNAIHNRISGAKNNLISPQDYATNPTLIGDDQQSGRPRIAEIYAAYNLRLQRSGAMDFDDLLFKTNILLRDFPDLLHKYQQKFAFILVDEYQDTNFAQYMIIRQLGAARENVCVVGDDAQSIYSFRGANIQNILNFQRDYPDCVVYKLEQNYRSTQTIVEAANCIISKNQDQIEKTVWTGNEVGNKIDLLRFEGDRYEGKGIAASIAALINNEGANPEDIAVLYRTNSQSGVFESSLFDLNIFPRVVGGLPAHQRKENKDLIAYLKLVTNPDDDESFKRAIKLKDPSRRIGDTTLLKLATLADLNQSSIWAVIGKAAEKPQGIDAGTWTRLKGFKEEIEAFSMRGKTQNAHELADHIAKQVGLFRLLLKEKTPEAMERHENLMQFIQNIETFVFGTGEAGDEPIRTLDDFLERIALMTDADEKSEDNERVTLMTVHASKGLEYKYVYIVGLEDGLFPSHRALGTRDELEEERRLFYVALTRAEKKAVLSYALVRARFGKLEQQDPSRFLEEIDSKYLNTPSVSANRPTPFDFDAARSQYHQMPGTNRNPYQKKSLGSSVSSTTSGSKFKRIVQAPQPADTEIDAEKAPTSYGEIAPGVQVKHARFGKGKVLKLEGEAPNIKATVFFPSAGQKQLLLKFAKLEVIG